MIPPAPSAPASQAPPGFVALVAEGSAAGNRIVRRVLGSFGVTRIIEARDGAEVLGAFAERRPDLVVLDWEQGVVPAAEILACIRDEASSDWPGQPVVVVTMAGPTQEAVERAMAFKVDAIVAKPCSTATLRSRLEAALFRPMSGA